MPFTQLVSQRGSYPTREGFDPGGRPPDVESLVHRPDFWGGGFGDSERLNSQRNLFLDPLPKGEWLRDLPKHDMMRILCSLWPVKKGLMLERASGLSSDQTFRWARRASASTDAIVAGLLVNDIETIGGWDVVDQARRSLLANFLNDHDGFTMTWKVYCSAVKRSVLVGERPPVPPRAISWAKKLKILYGEGSLKLTGSQRLIAFVFSIFSGRATSPAGKKIVEKSLQKWKDLLSSVPERKKLATVRCPENDIKPSNKCVIRPTIVETGSFETSVSNGGKATEQRRLVRDLLSKGGVLANLETGERTEFNPLDFKGQLDDWIEVELDHTVDYPDLWRGISPDTFLGVRISKNKMMIPWIQRIPWGEILVRYYLAQDTNFDRIRVCTVKEPGKARVITCPETGFHTIFSCVTHSLSELLAQKSELLCGLTASRNGWEFYKSMENFFSGRDGNMYDRVFVCSDMEQATDHPPFEVAIDALAWLLGSINCPKFLQKRILGMIGPRRVFDENGLDQEWSTKRGILMGDPCTKHILTIVHYVCVLKSSWMLRGEKIYFRVNGDDFIGLLPKSGSKAFFAMYKSNIAEFGAKLSDVDTFVSPFAGTYCEEVITRIRSHKDLYSRVIYQEEKEFPYLDNLRPLLFNTIVESDSPHVGLLGRAAALSRELGYQFGSASWKGQRYRRGVAFQYALFGRRVRNEWVNHPLGHESFMFLPGFRQPSWNWEHHYIYQCVVTQWGWDGREFHPRIFNPGDISRIRRRNDIGLTTLSRTTTPPGMAEYEVKVPADVLAWTSLIEIPTTLVREKDLVQELGKRLKSLDLLFPDDLLVREEFITKTTTDLRSVVRLNTDLVMDLNWYDIYRAFKMAFEKAGKIYFREALDFKVFPLTGGHVPLNVNSMAHYQIKETIKWILGVDRGVRFGVEAYDTLLILMARCRRDLDERLIVGTNDLKLKSRLMRINPNLDIRPVRSDWLTVGYNAIDGGSLREFHWAFADFSRDSLYKAGLEELIDPLARANPEKLTIFRSLLIDNSPLREDERDLDSTMFDRSLR